MKTKYLDEICRQLIILGFRCIPVEGKNMYCEISKDQEPVDILFNNGLLNTNAVQEVNQSVQNTMEYLENFEKAEALDVAEVRDRYKKLLEFNGTVLAMKEFNSIDGYEFVTWQYSRDREAVNFGHYFTDYKAAKEDFANRSGLVDYSKMFKENQMKLLDKITDLIPEIITHEVLEENGLLADDELEL